MAAPPPPSRRPLASRNTAWAQALARRLAAAGATPNAISAAGLAAAVLSGAAFWAAGAADGGAGRSALLLLGALLVQIRLLCNLLDGMVAIEGGRKSPLGALWNEAPDRAADIAILAGLGLAAGAPALGWAAAAMAVVVAYARTLGTSLGQREDFGGPLAKPQRMALVTGAAVLAAAAPLWGGGGPGLLALALWVVVAGAALTAALRLFRLAGRLRRQGAAGSGPQ